jgi:hypothetical protein
MQECICPFLEAIISVGTFIGGRYCLALVGVALRVDCLSAGLRIGRRRADSAADTGDHPGLLLAALSFHGRHRANPEVRQRK